MFHKSEEGLYNGTENDGFMRNGNEMKMTNFRNK